MGIKDAVFSLGLKSDKFDKGVKGAQAELKKLAAVRLEGLQKELADLSKAGSGADAGRLRALTREFNELSRVSGGTKKSLGSFFGTLKAGFGMGIGLGLFNALKNGFRSLIGVIPSLFSKAIDAGVNSRRVAASLARALENAGQSPQAMQAMSAMASNVQKVFHVDDEEMLDAYEKLVTAGMDANQAMKSSTLVVDLAAKKNLSLAKAAEVVGKVFNGETRALQRLGIFLTSTGTKAGDAAKGLAHLRQLTRGAAMEQGRLKNPFEAMKISLGDIFETIGLKLLPKIEPIIQKAVDFVSEFQNTERFEQIVEGLTSMVKGVFEWAQNLAMSLDFDNLGASLWQIVKEIGSFLFDLLVRAGEIIGDKIRVAVLGETAGKSANQKIFEKYQAEYGGMTPEARAAEIEKTRALISGGSLGTMANNEAQWRLKALEEIQAGRKGFGEMTFDDIANKHFANARAMAAGGSAVANLAAKGAANRQQVAQQMAAMQSQPIGVSRRAIAMDAQKQRKPAPKRSNALAGLVQRSSGQMRLQVTSLGGHIHPVAVN